MSTHSHSLQICGAMEAGNTPSQLQKYQRRCVASAFSPCNTAHQVYHPHYRLMLRSQRDLLSGTVSKQVNNSFFWIYLQYVAHLAR